MQDKNQSKNQEDQKNQSEQSTLTKPQKQKPIQNQIRPDLEIKTRGFINIYYGTTGGNSCTLAFDLSNDARQHGFYPLVIHLGNFNEQQLQQCSLAIFCVSTYGYGGPTSDAQDFNNWLNKIEHSNTILKNLKYTVFGLGNSKYEKFCNMGINTDRRLEELGAQRIYQLGKGDANNNQTQSQFNQWKKNLWQTLTKQFQEVMMKESELQKQGIQYIIEKNQAGTQEVDLNNASTILNQQNLEKSVVNYIESSLLPVVEIKELRQKPAETSCLFLDLNVANSSCEKYQTAGNIAIYPENDQEIVEDIAYILGYDLDMVFSLKGKNENCKLPLPSPISVRTFLQKFCDLLGPISKNTLYVLSQYVTDQKNKQLLEQLCAFTAFQEYNKQIIEQKHSLFSIIQQYQIQLPLEILISISQRILPRYYTISSSNLLYPKNIHLTVSMLKINSAQRKGLGLTSQYIQSGINNKQFAVKAFLSESQFSLPQDPNVNIIMIANGAGLAPFRAFYQEKLFYKKNNLPNKLGQLTLIFGCRGKNIDYIYQQEIEQMVKEGVLNNLFVAYSREKSKKVYVQDVLSLNSKLIGKLFFLEKGKLYICGSQEMGEAVFGVLETIVQETKNMKPYIAYNEIQKLSQNGSIVKEIWG